ncbi:methyl-accepting chemotaxis protein [Brachyspira sp. SAP_772]|uniref:methyl-accepting chemotaxis protein n=1 Tax=Brachyspira sp. SAP_772 TaxID=2608385 RepID=UPI0012F4D69F|nr:methyl-accepting chemotaxis protein [Brachyspira sp. SAP_772]
MDVLTSFIPGYNVSIIELLVPIVGTSMVFIFIMLYTILLIKTRDRIYIIVELALLFLLVYNILSFVIIFLGISGNNVVLASNLYVINHIIFLFVIALLPINNRFFLKNKKFVGGFSNLIIFITILVVVSLVVISIINKNTFFNTTLRTYPDKAFSVIGNGNFFVYLTYLSLIIYAMAFVPMVIDIFFGYNIVGNTIIILSNLLSFVLVITNIEIFNLRKDIYFDKLDLAVILSYLISSVAIFSSFTRNALESIRKDTILNNRLKSNLNIVTEINEISEKLNSIDKNFMDSSMFVFEVDKENKDALNIIESKINTVIDSKNKLIDTKESKKHLIIDGIKFTNTIFTFFDKYKNQMQDHFRALAQTMANMNVSNLSYEQISSLNNDLKEIRNNIEESSNNAIVSIKKHFESFKDVNKVTEDIYDTIEYIKNMTNKTNLLSINAGIQASKAGVLGKSFSVVSKEIGVLSFEISKGTASIESMLTDIFGGLVLIENSSFYIDDHCKNIENETKQMLDKIDAYSKNIEERISKISTEFENFKLLEKYNNVMYKIVEEQNDIVSSVRENIVAMLDIQNSLNLKIDSQGADIIKILGSFSRIIEVKDELDDVIMKIGNYSSASHTYIEMLSNIISTHSNKSSIAFKPIITLLKK